MLRPTLALLAGSVLLGGCPSAVDSPGVKPEKVAPAAQEDDPRVAREGQDLYAKKVIERSELGRHEPPVEGTPGTGKPDESNGVCRLYAPKAKDPECCTAQLGFDAKTVSTACGHDTYLGESFRYSCGYYFHRDGGKKPAWFRLSVIPGESTKDAAASHDRRMKRMVDDSFESTLIPGVPDALWSRHDGLAWAFLPGWKGVRQLAWRDEFCDQGKMVDVIKQLIAAKEPPPGTRRGGLVPSAD